MAEPLRTSLDAAPLRPVRLGEAACAVVRDANGVIRMHSPLPLEAFPDKLTQRLEYWAAMFVGVPYAPISVPYSLMSSDFGKLKSIIEILTPGLVFAADGKVFARAIAAAVPVGVEIVTTVNPLGDRFTTSFADLVATEPTDAIDAAHAKVGPDTVAKILFTSGSTGYPKGVINTQRMLCSNQAMIRGTLAFIADEPPVLVDWPPWNHTFGGNHDFGMVLYNGGSFYIDEGRPLPGAIEATVRNLREIAPTIHLNVPKGFEMLLPYFRSDAALRQNFFSKLKVLFYAGAALQQYVWDELQELALATTGERIIFLSSLGSTETAPAALARTWESEHSGNIGLPMRGVELKLVPAGGKLEARLRGPNITPGYWRRPDLTADAFDDEGYYKIGDALKFVDPAEPLKGLLFDGRIAEDFKLATGTWVSSGALRSKFVDHCAPLVRDAVIAGADRDDVTVLVFPDVEACRRLAGLAADASAGAVLSDPTVRGEFKQRLGGMARQSTGSSTRVCRAILMEEPPSLDAGEVTDKGSINQRAVLTRRAGLVEELYAAAKSPRVIAIEE
jgi:feruloyl-CoA synthase